MKLEDKAKLVELLADQAFNSNSNSIEYFKDLLRESHIPRSMVYEAVSVLDENPETAARNLVDWALSKGTNPEQDNFKIIGNLLYPLLSTSGLEGIRFLVEICLTNQFVGLEILRSNPFISQHFDSDFWFRMAPRPLEKRPVMATKSSDETSAEIDSSDHTKENREKIWQSFVSLPDAQFEQILFILKTYNLPPENIPSAQSPKASRVSAVFEWAESQIGCGLDKLSETINGILVPYDSAASRASSSLSQAGKEIPVHLIKDLSTPEQPNYPEQTEKFSAQKLSKFSFNMVTFNDSDESVEYRSCSAEFYRESLPDGIILDMVKVYPGRLLRDSTYIDMPAFWMSKYPVTQAQWRTVSQLPALRLNLNANPTDIRDGNHPVVKVSYLEALEFCDRLSAISKHNYTLPNENEWEYACGAEANELYHFGSKITPDFANYKAPSFHVYPTGTTPVGSFKVGNKFGLFDMHGNVWEWCTTQNIYCKDNGKEINNEIQYGHDITQVLRGGSWFDAEIICSCKFTRRVNPTYRDNHIGFRVISYE